MNIGQRVTPKTITNYMGPGGIIIVLLSAFIWRFALIGAKTLFQGDASIFGLPLFDLRARVVEGRASLLWASGVYGGHPLFAEGQAAFFSPLPMILAAVVKPIAGVVYTLNLFPFLCMVLTGLGMIGLCRSLNIGRWSAAFAALAVVFSPSWLGMQVNSVWSGSTLWVPWCLWAMETWLKVPSLRSAAVMGAALGSEILAGYPQAFHGTLIYMAVSLITIPIARSNREEWRSTLRARVISGLVAVIVCGGLAAVQLLPLAELVPLSHRKNGIGLVFQVSEMFFARGMFFSFPWAANVEHFAKANIGSLFVCIFASMLVGFNRTPRLLGHLAAGLFLIELGTGAGSPLFTFLYDHDLVPGLHYFRTVDLYLPLGGVGFAVAAAGAIDGLSRRRIEAWRQFARSQYFWALVAGGIFWRFELERYASRDVPAIQFAIPLAGILVGSTLAAFRRLDWAPIFMVGLLITECLSLRTHYFHLIEAAAAEKPDSVREIESRPDWRDYRIADASTAGHSIFDNIWNVSAVPNYRRLMSSMTGMTPVLWGLRSIEGALALPMTRTVEARALIGDEIAGRTGSTPGLRLMDLLGVRFVSADKPISTPGFQEFWHGRDGAWVMENTAALPRFQIYDRYMTVDTPEEALAVIRSWHERMLVIENPQHREFPTDSDDQATRSDPGGVPATLALQKAFDDRYRLEVSAQRPCWLFLADANYPGWSATVDGQATQVFSAQLLGKAVEVPAGRHLVKIEFHSASFVWGAWISAISLVLTVCLIAGWPLGSFGKWPTGQRHRLAPP